MKKEGKAMAKEKKTEKAEEAKKGKKVEVKDLNTKKDPKGGARISKAQLIKLQ